MEFVFAKNVDRDNLRQGDLLQRTPELQETIEEAHSHYASAATYTHFIVLTQTCDLVRRGPGKKCKSRYISVAAVRPLDLLVERKVGRLRADIDFPFQVCQKDHRTEATQLLERLLHNTEDSFFFIRKGSAPTVNRDMCAFLPLSIALKAEHYDACLSAKVAQLNDIFAAKLGWLTGNLYSRIATPDIEEEIEGDSNKYKEEFFDEVLHAKTAWLSPAQIRELKRLTKDWRKQNPDRDLDEGTARDILNRVPEDIELIARRAVAILQGEQVLEKTEEVTEMAKKLLINDKNFQRLVRIK